MAAYYPQGYKVPLANGSQAVIKKKLGEGGQGVVYLVELGGKDYALKWYHKGSVHDPDAFYRNLENNIAKGAPTKAFLWPLYITKRSDDSFGYIMDLRPQNYREFSEFLLARTRFTSLTAVTKAALNITNGFRELHRSGFSYQDLNDGNFFIDPNTGDVLICDNDNVAPYGESLGIAGKARYMAPEVVRNMKRPDAMTDRFSLTVVLYRLLFLDHPLEGKKVVETPCLTEALELKYYGKEPVFVYDPTDDSNRPVRGVHPNEMRLWGMYPEFVRKKFIKALSKECMTGTETRPTDNEWQLTFSRLRDCIVKCSCGEETFLDLGGSDSKCLNCGRIIPKPALLSCHKDKYILPMYPGVKIYRLHIDSSVDDYNEVVGRVVSNPNDPTLIGILNVSDIVWNIETQKGEIRPLEKGKLVPVPAVKAIHFPNGTAVIE